MADVLDRAFDLISDLQMEESKPLLEKILKRDNLHSICASDESFNGLFAIFRMFLSDRSDHELT